MTESVPEKKFMGATWAAREVDHLFGRLGYYTRFVGFSKWMLGLVGLVLLGSLIAWPLLRKDQSGIRISFVDSSAKKDGNAPPATVSPVMSNPEYIGSTEKNEPYHINGIKATQVTPTLMVVDQVKGHLQKADNGWADLTADRAEYHQDVKIIELFGNVTVTDDRGYHFVTPHATINTATSDIHGTDPVQGTGPTGNIVASGFEIKDNATHITFTRGADPVHLHIDRTKKSP